MVLRLIFILCLFGAASHATAKEPAVFTSAIMHTALHQAGIAKQPLITIEGTSVRMVTFATDAEYKPAGNHLSETLWTTVEPELKTLCQQYVAKHPGITSAALSLWLAKVLGLPTEDATKRRFIVMDVPVIQAYYGSPGSTIGIFRPCTDPRIGKHADGSAICPKKMDANDSKISTDYKTWFINNSLESYQLEKGLPWTGYGYTYNWDTEARTVHGVSEFVVLKNTPMMPLKNPQDPSTIYISAKQYCKP